MQSSRAHAASDSPAAPPATIARRAGVSAPESLVTDRRHRTPWPRRYRQQIRVVDAIILVAAVATAQVVWFGGSEDVAGTSALSYSGLGAIIAVSWWVALQLYGATDVRTVGIGPQEYRRVLQASITVFGVLSIATVLLRFGLSRGYLAIAFPAGLLGLLVARKVLRSLVWRRLRRGELASNVLVVGSARSATTIAHHLTAHRAAGLQVSGVWVPDEPEAGHRWLDGPTQSVPILGSARDLEDALLVAAADVVIVTDTEHLGPNGLKELTWQLQSLGVDLIVSPNVVDIATPRVKLSVIGAMPFLHLEAPTYEGTQRWGKLLFDKVVASLALVVVSPVMLAAAVAVALTSRGPVLYKSTRVGVGGAPFKMLKFRTMVWGADRLKSRLASDADGVLFKMRDDPRVTRVGGFLRRWSIDELPQFLNVLRGEMSIVGPRPPLPEEVASYTDGVERRLLVKQGITGLWQVSGRSDLSWERTVALDLDYVENWSLVRDLHIVWLTFLAVVRGRGAY